MPNNKKTADDITFNVLVGRNIKYLRKCRKLNQTKVANHCKVKFQQLQKYEKGINGCSAFRLHQLAKFFKVSMDVLIDPEMITKHRGFTGDMDWLDHEIEIEKQQEKQALTEEVQKEMMTSGNRISEVIAKCP